MIWVRLFSYDPLTVFMGIFVAFYSIFLICLYGGLKLKNIVYEKKHGNEEEFEQKKNKLRLWKILCFVPMILSVFHFIFFRIKPVNYYTLRFYGGFYLASVLMMLLPIFAGRRIGWQIGSKIILFFVFAGFAHTFLFPISYWSAMRNYSMDSWTEAFEKTTEDMEKYYSLKEHKDVDISAIRDEILPLVEKAEEIGDEGLFYAAMVYYSYKFFDGHVSTYGDSYDGYWRGLMLLSGYDYGMSMVQLDDGSVIAAAVYKGNDGSNAYSYGIDNGTEIVSWNGVPIKDALAQVECVYENMDWPVAENENILKPVFLATKGLAPDSAGGIGTLKEQLLWRATEISDEVSYAINSDADFQKIIPSLPKAVVGFIASDGTEKEAVLTPLEYGANRLESMVQALFNKTYDSISSDNFKTFMLTEKTGLLRIYAEETNILRDIVGYLTGRDKSLREIIAEEIDGLREQGMTKLIIDARNNIGGFPTIDRELAALFTDETFVAETEASCINGKYRELKKNYVYGDGRFKDIEVIVLTDCFCVSAGDYLVKVMGECPNVTVMGMTTSDCSCQATGGLNWLSGICEVVYPVNWMFDETGRRWIDTDKSRVYTMQLDEKIPLTEYAVDQMLYNFGSDYQLQYALSFLESDAPEVDFVSLHGINPDDYTYMTNYLMGKF